MKMKCFLVHRGNTWRRHQTISLDASEVIVHDSKQTQTSWLCLLLNLFPVSHQVVSLSSRDAFFFPSSSTFLLRPSSRISPSSPLFQGSSSSISSLVNFQSCLIPVVSVDLFHFIFVWSTPHPYSLHPYRQRSGFLINTTKCYPVDAKLSMSHDFSDCLIQFRKQLAYYQCIESAEEQIIWTNVLNWSHWCQRNKPEPLYHVCRTEI